FYPKLHRTGLAGPGLRGGLLAEQSLQESLHRSSPVVRGLESARVPSIGSSPPPRPAEQSADSFLPPGRRACYLGSVPATPADSGPCPTTLPSPSSSAASAPATPGPPRSWSSGTSPPSTWPSAPA